MGLFDMFSRKSDVLKLSDVQIKKEIQIIAEAPLNVSVDGIKRSHSNDTFQSTLLGTNVYNNGVPRDPRMTFSLVNDLTPWTYANTLYTSCYLARKVIDIPVDDALREGFEVVVKDNVKATEFVKSMFEEFEVLDAVKVACKSMRAFGGNGMYMVTDDEDLTLPLIEGTEVKGLLNFAGGLELFGEADWIDDPFKKNYGYPKFYTIKPSIFSKSSNLIGKPIHHSRFIRFSDPVLYRVERVRRYGFGQSVFDTCYEPIRNLWIFENGMSEISTKWDQGIFYKSGWNDKVISAGDDDDKSAAEAKIALLAVFKSMDQIRSNNGSIILDAGGKDIPPEKFEHVSPNVTGVEKISPGLRVDLSTASAIPMLRLYGEQPSGMNATGNSSIRFYYDEVSTKQRDIARRVKALAKMMLVGSGFDLDSGDIEVKFPPLWQPTGLEKAQEEKAIEEALKLKFDMMTANRALYEEISKSRV
jgi:phage-related protein (TIGR01555 family)